MFYFHLIRMISSSILWYDIGITILLVQKPRLSEFATELSWEWHSLLVALFDLYYCTTNYHHLSGLKKFPFIISKSCGSEVQVQVSSVSCSESCQTEIKILIGAVVLIWDLGTSSELICYWHDLFPCDCDLGPCLLAGSWWGPLLAFRGCPYPPSSRFPWEVQYECLFSSKLAGADPSDF